MAKFETDRQALPGPWDDPLVFRLKRGERTVEVEVQRDAAIAFAWAPQHIGGLASSAALDQIDLFLLDLEEAVERLYDENPQERLSLNWRDIYPDQS